jgi:hypothetical protein
LTTGRVGGWARWYSTRSPTGLAERCPPIHELWLSKIERDLIARGIFTSTADLSRKLLRYIREHNKTAKPIKWKYTDVRRGIRAPHSAVTGH